MNRTFIAAIALASCAAASPTSRDAPCSQDYLSGLRAARTIAEEYATDNAPASDAAWTACANDSGIHGWHVANGIKARIAELESECGQ